MRILERAGQKQVDFPATVSSPYVNTIPSDEEPEFPGDEYLERRIRAFIRWNAAVMVVRANVRSEAIGGHLSTYASSASLYEVGFNHFFRGKDDGRPGDQVYFQGHASPGIYARAFVEGRLSEEQLDNFRFEVGGRRAVLLPAPAADARLLGVPDGLDGARTAQRHRPGPRQPLPPRPRDRRHRRPAGSGASSATASSTSPRPSALSGMAGREHLDNLIFVVNCNLQRLDGPVRGNGKIIQELEALFRGAGWNVIKVIWGRTWDELLARDVDGVLLNKMNTTVDGEFQKYATESGAYIREHFFGPDPRLRALVEHLSDEELQIAAPRRPRLPEALRRLQGGHRARGAPTAILAKTIKGWTLGPEIEARNATHQIKKMTKAQLLALRDRLFLHDEIPEERPRRRPAALLPAGPGRAGRAGTWPSAGRPSAGRCPAGWCRPGRCPPPGPGGVRRAPGRLRPPVGVDHHGLRPAAAHPGPRPAIGRRIVPIIPDEARTFGLESLISEVQIYAPRASATPRSTPGWPSTTPRAPPARSSRRGSPRPVRWPPSPPRPPSYATWGEPMIPFYLFYSMFGFQRVGDLLWALGDMRGRGFLLGCTAGRTTLNGEGLQHQDGHSLLLASTVPNVAAYDPAFAYEVATIVEDGIRRMTGPEPEDRLLVPHALQRELPDAGAPARPRRRPNGSDSGPSGASTGSADGADRQSVAGRRPTPGTAARATLLFSGSAWQAADRGPAAAGRRLGGRRRACGR